MALRSPAAAAPVSSIPRLSRLAKAQSALVALFLALAALRYLVAPLDRFDEGVTVTKGALIALGQVPYRDFWMTYGPLDSLLLGGAFKVAGAGIVVERVLGFAVLVALGAVAYAITGHLRLRGALRLLLTGLITVTPLAVPAFNSAFLADAVGLGAVLAYLVSLDQPGRRLALLAGALVALVSFARPEFAVALGVGLTIGYLLPVVRRASSPTTMLLPYLAGLAAMGVLLWGVTIALAGIEPVWFDLVTYALTLYPRGRSIPFGQGPEAAVVLTFSLAFALTWLWAGRRAYQARRDTLEPARILALLLASMLAFTWVRTRSDGIHAFDAWPLAAVLLALLLQRRQARQRSAPPSMEAVASIVGIFLFTAGVGGLATRDLLRPAQGPAIPRASLSGARSWMPTADLARLIDAIDAATPDRRPIWVGLQRNDLVVFNDTMLYFLSDRVPGTVYYETFPGLTNEDQVERTIACQLDRSGVTLAVLGPNGAGEPWNLSSVPGSSYLDRWLADRTISRTAIGGYDLLRLRPASPSAARCP